MKLSYQDYEMADNYLNWLNHQCFKKKAELKTQALPIDALTDELEEIENELHTINILRHALENDI